MPTTATFVCANCLKCYNEMYRESFSRVREVDGTCGCGDPVKVYLPYMARAPRKNASKRKWARFVSMFVDQKHWRVFKSLQVQLERESEKIDANNQYRDDVLKKRGIINRRHRYPARRNFG